MGSSNIRSFWAFLIGGLLLILALAAYVDGLGMAALLSAHFGKPAQTVEADNADEYVAPVPGASQKIVGTLVSLSEWSNTFWWQRVFAAVSMGAFGLGLAFMLAATHTWISRGSLSAERKMRRGMSDGDNAWP
jgi:hypothetical protein